MAITSAICNSFKQEILVEGHNFTGSSCRTHLNSSVFKQSATLSKSTTVWAAASDPTADPTSYL